MRRVAVAGACEGHALCTGIAPQVFDMSDDGERAIVTADPIPEEMLPAVRQAVASCPVQAISLEEDQ